MPPTARGYHIWYTPLIDPKTPWQIEFYERVDGGYAQSRPLSRTTSSAKEGGPMKEADQLGSLTFGNSSVIPKCAGLIEDEIEVPACGDSDCKDAPEKDT